MRESISYCCIILAVTIILISNVSVTIASKHAEHDDSHDSEHDSKDIFDLLHHELGGKNEIMTSNELVKLYDELHLKMCTPTVQPTTKADNWCNTVS